jgi:hypothetical protein
MSTRDQRRLQVIHEQGLLEPSASFRTALNPKTTEDSSVKPYRNQRETKSSSMLLFPAVSRASHTRLL